MILYINSCVREESRTDIIARKVLEKMGGEYEELYLPDAGLKPLSRQILKKRNELIEKGDFDDPIFDYAKQFAKADKIVISAPFWDYSFPSVLKVYIENIYAIGLVTTYDECGNPMGLCKADELVYVSTAGGAFVGNFGYEYVKALSKFCFGIKETRLIKAEMLDVEGVDVNRILADTIVGID